jgi:hypothetical protein
LGASPEQSGRAQNDHEQPEELRNVKMIHLDLKD